jgi:hypothetical protein
MKNFFSKLGQTGANIGVIVISIVVFLVAFFVVNGIANSQKPDTVDILAAARDLGVGEAIAPQDLVVKTVFVDDNAAMYIAADEEGIASVANGTIVVPVFVGQPILRTSVVARAGESNRLSALLANYPEGGSLFPLPLDFANVVSPDIDTFLPGDLVSITVVISSRPQPPVTPTVMPEFITGDSPYIGIAPQVVATPIPLDTELDKSKALLYPPLSKDLFPEGIRVIEIQGGTELVDTSADTGDTVDPAAGYIDFNKPKTLILLVPDNKREELALALQEGDMLVISLLSRGSEASTEGFSYWDFEEWLKNEREAAYKDSLSSPTPQPLPSPTFTPTPTTEGN